jgi:hypothetical protein
MAKNGEGDYPIGYRRPPRATQFQPGHSGNPKGRPKGILNVARVLERELRERVVINEGGRRRTVSKLEAAMKQVVNKAASGDLGALKLLHALVISAEESAAQIPQQAPEVITENDQRVLQSILARMNGRVEKTKYDVESK